MAAKELSTSMRVKKREAAYILADIVLLLGSARKRIARETKLVKHRFVSTGFISNLAR